MGKLPFRIDYDPLVRDHLETIDKKHHALIRERIEEQLRYEPGRETRNRKRLLRPVEFGAGWELRCGPDNRFRVFYEVIPGANQVQVLAVGVKKGNRLFIAGKETEL